MILSFYDKDFNGLKNNASLIVDKKGFSITKRPIELNDFSCVCEAITEDIQPTFIVVKDDRGRETIYSSFAGVPILNADNKTEITGTDLKSMFVSDVVMQFTTYSSVGEIINALFDEWESQVNKGAIKCRIKYENDADLIPLIEDFEPTLEKDVYDVFTEMQFYLNAYNLYMDSRIDLVEKEVVFTIGKTMVNDRTIKLWEYGIRSFGKWVADINEVQGFLVDDNGIWSSYKDDNGENVIWILTSDNQITIDKSKRDIYPIKKKVFVSNESREQANKDALKELLNARFNENIELPVKDFKPDFETKFNVYLRKGEELYKSLPCGELIYDADGLCQYQIGYRYTGIDFI